MGTEPTANGWGELPGAAQALLTGTHDAVWLLDPDSGIIVAANARAARMLGKAEGALVGAPIASVIEDGDELRALTARTLEHGEGSAKGIACCPDSGPPPELRTRLLRGGDRRLVAFFAHDVSDREWHRLRSEDLERTLAEERAMREINAAISAHLERASLFRAISEAIGKVVPIDRLGLVIVPPDGSPQIYALESHGEASTLAVGSEIPAEGTIAPTVLQSGEARFTANIEELAAFPRTTELLRGDDITTAAFIPLRMSGDVGGVLYLGRHTPGGFDKAARDLLCKLADPIAVALDNCRAYEEITALSVRLRHNEQRGRMQLELNNALVSNLAREALLPAIAHAMTRVIGSDFASITTYDPVEDTITLFALTGPQSEGFVPVGTAFDRVGSHLQPVIDERQPLVVDNLRELPKGGLVDELIAQGIRAFVAVPLRHDGRVIGTLNAGSTKTGAYDAQAAEQFAAASTQVALAVANMLAYEEIANLKRRLERENDYLQEELRNERDFREIVGESAALQRVLSQVDAVAKTNANVLVLGESGVGKELVARAIHDRSSRAKRPLVKVNCASVPKELFESEFFGHVKGAFTGALKTREGRFQLADGGTLFLDEVGEIPIELQGKLLRVLQEQEFERVGDDRTRKVDVRVIAATNRDLEAEAAAGRFRQDLYYRLNVFPIRVPPLRERRPDVPALARHFLGKASRDLKVPATALTSADEAMLEAYDWPGNVRELQNVMERAAILAMGEALDLRMALPGLAGPANDDPAQPLPTRTGTVLNAEQWKALERDNIIAALEQAQWKVAGDGGAAAVLGVKPSTLSSRMRALGIKRPGG